MRSEIGLDALPWVADHTVGGLVVLPGSVYLGLMLAASGATGLRDVRFERILPVSAYGTRTLVTRVDGDEVTVTDPDGVRYARALALHGGSVPDPVTFDAEAVDAVIQQRAAEAGVPEPYVLTAIERFRPGDPVGELAGERFAPLSPATIAIAGTFTTEPLAEPLRFWLDLLGLPATIEFAGYDQVHQQLLDPGSLLARNTDGLNVVLLGPRAQLGDGLAQLLPYETEFLYDEIFVRQAYLRHGVELRDGDVVFDVGANIGLFTLFAHRRAAGLRVFAFEPGPAAYEALRRNTAAHGPGTRVFDYGLADADGEAPFTNYPRASVFSGFAADAARDARALDAVVAATLRRELPAGSPALGPLVRRLTRGRLASETLTRPTRTVSSVLREHGVGRIDLLKIDAEGSEAAILAGIDPADWPRIRQLVIECHDPDEAERVQALLTEHGYAVATDELVPDTGFVNLYARRPAERRPPKAEPQDEPAAAIEAFRARSPVPLLVLNTDEPPAGRATPYADRLGRVPYDDTGYAALATRIARHYHALRTPDVKVLVLDCDGTLWSGVCGEDGPDGVVPRRDVQEFALRQRAEGVLLCLCSRNHPDDVDAVFARRTDMPLRPEHVTARRIGWGPKPVALRELAAELGLGLDAFAFLDDDPVACAEMRAELPETLTLRVPDDDPEFFAHLWAFDRARVTDDDAQRARRHADEARRRAARAEAPTLESYLRGLDLRVEIAPGTEADVPRVAQLTRRTNQFTVTGVRRTEAEVRGTSALTVRATDKHGDYGLIGAILYEPTPPVLTVDAFVLSCRALGRGIEHRMLAHLGHLAQDLDCAVIELPSVTTGRNEPARVFLARHAEEDDGRFHLTAQAAATVRFRPTTASTAARRSQIGGRVLRGRPAETPAKPFPQFVGWGWGRSEVYQRIAGELRDPGSVRAAARRVRGRPELPGYTAATGEVEGRVAEIWREVLGVDRVGADDNFFELGGTSLLGVRVMAEVAERFGRDVADVDLYERPTVRLMADLLRSAGVPPGEAGTDRGRRRRARRASRG